MHHFQVTIEFSLGASMRFRIAILIGILLALATVSGAAEETPLLAHSPTVSKTQVVVLCRKHRCRTVRGLAGFVQLPASGFTECLCGGPQEGRSLAFSSSLCGSTSEGSPFLRTAA